jgi:hypothetical protein
MAATVTLASTSLGANCGTTDRAINVLSTANITPGLFLFMDRELMKVDSIGLPSVAGGTMVNVRRGVAGTHSMHHNTVSPIYIGQGYQFYNRDPKGAPEVVVYVVPYINIETGVIWWPQGDDYPTVGPSNLGLNRWWQAQDLYGTGEYGIGPLGVRTRNLNPSSGQ